MRMMMVAGLALAVMASPALAVVTGGGLTGGNAVTGGGVSGPGGVFQIIAPPAAVGQDNFGNNNVRAFNERQLVTLSSALAVDTGAAIAAGTVVRSHAINFDPSRSRDVEGFATFNTPILGLIWSRANLIASNFLGAPGTTYLTPSAVGFETAQDSARFLGNKVTFKLQASRPGDTFRVITAAVPEPATWAMLLTGFGLVGLAGRRRSRSVAA